MLVRRAGTKARNVDESKVWAKGDLVLDPLRAVRGFKYEEALQLRLCFSETLRKLRELLRDFSRTNAVHGVVAGMVQCTVFGRDQQTAILGGNDVQ